MTTLTMLSHLHQLQALLTSAWMGLSELVSVAAILWILNATARAIRIVYLAGLWTGHITKRYIIPALLWIADHISLAISKVDWAEVLTVFMACAKVIIAAVIAVVTISVDHIRRDVPAAYAWVERNFIDVPDAIENSSQVKPQRMIRRHGRLITLALAN